MTSPVGTKLAHYEILEPIGRGGMGEVYRARDSKLERDVAIKVLPDDLAQDEERRKRFQREARVLASLNHSGIASIYGVEQSEAKHYLVLELVSGETLADRIARGPIPLEEALDVAIQIAEALEEAHEHGIVHRDLKPANIKLTPDGRVKVLDFGLAKAFREEAGEADGSRSPTVTRGTAAGVILGTAAYMSPEQMKGHEVDKRADVFAFGAVLYEMLSGKRAFPGDSTTECLASVLTAEPDWSALPASTPRAVRRVLERALEKDLRKRQRHLGDAGRDLADAREERQRGLPDGSADRPASSRIVSMPVFVTAVLVALVAGSLVYRLTLAPSEEPTAVIRSTIRAEGPVEPHDRNLAVSPSRDRIVYAANGRLYLRELDRLESRALPETEGAHGPFFSPSGEWVGFFADNELKRMLLNGGSPERLAIVANGQHGTWSEDDWIYFSTSVASKIFRVPASGGDPEPVTDLGPDIDHNYPRALPGGRAILFSAVVEGDVDWNDATIAVHSLGTGERKDLADNGNNARYLESGHVLYHRAGTLMAMPFDITELEVTGESRIIHRGVSNDFLGQNALYDVSEEGLLVYVAGAAAERSRLVLVDRTGKETQLDIEPAVYSEPRLSPDGSRVAYTLGARVGIHDLERGTTDRLTGGFAFFPLWMPDGERIAFTSDPGGGNFGLFSQAADGTGEPALLVRGSHALAIGPDGRELVFRRADPWKGFEILTTRIGSGGEPRSLELSESFAEPSASLSPDGRFIAYALDESGDSRVYVRAFPGIGSRRALVGPGMTPVWGPDGRELFYTDAAGSGLYRVVVESEDPIQLGRPELVLHGSDYALVVSPRNTFFSGLPNFDVSPDGRSFLLVKPVASTAERGDPREIVLVLNWFEELRTRVPTD